MRSIHEVETFLFGLRSHTDKAIGKDMTLDRMWPLLEKVGNPQRNLKVVHVAGTSGKTSTSVYIATLLQHAGFRTGLTVSPHIESITERLQVNGKPLAENEFADLFTRFIQLFDEDTIDATYFELMIVFVLWAFVEKRLEIAVLETGLGGLHDGTNVCQRNDKICVLTDIGFDHQEILGDSLQLIAQQKAGIVHKDNVVFMYEKPEEIQLQIDNRISEMHAKKFLVVEQAYDPKNILNKYQQRNWQLAYEVAKYLCELNGRTLDEKSLDNTKSGIIGRMQEIEVGSTKFIIDGAHNAQKAQALIESVSLILGGKKIPVILAVKQGKDLHGLIRALKPVIEYAVCTEYGAQQDMPVHSIPARVVEGVLRTQGIDVKSTSDVSAALRFVLKEKEPVVLVTGSLYMVGEVLRFLRNYTLRS